jgi:hypothetical protein
VQRPRLTSLRVENFSSQFNGQATAWASSFNGSDSPQLRGYQNLPPVELQRDGRFLSYKKK